MTRPSSGESVTCALSALAPLSRGSRPIASAMRLRERGHVGAGLREHVGRDAALLLEHRGKHMLGRGLRVVLGQRAGIGGVERLADAFGHLIDVHGLTIIPPNATGRISAEQLHEERVQIGSLRPAGPRVGAWNDDPARDSASNSRSRSPCGAPRSSTLRGLYVSFARNARNAAACARVALFETRVDLVEHRDSTLPSSS